MVSVFGLLLILILLGGAVGIVLPLLIMPKSRKPTLAVLGVLVVGGVGLALVLGLFYARVSYDETSELREQKMMQYATADHARAVDGSDPGNVINFDGRADVYPSRDLALQALLDHLPQQIKMTRLGLNDPKPVARVTVDGQNTQTTVRRGGGMSSSGEGGPDVRLYQPLKQKLTETYAGVEVLTRMEDRRPNRNDANDFESVIKITLSHNEVTGHGKPRSSIRLTVHGPQRSSTVTTSYIDEPWVAYFEDFKGDNALIMGQTANRSTSPDTAEDAAFKDAVRQLEPLVAGHLHEHPKLGNKRHIAGPRLRGDLKRELKRGSFVQKSFAQRIKRAGQDEYKHYLLIDSSQATVASLADRATVEQTTQAATRTVWGTMSAVVGLLVAIVVVYLVLNSLAGRAQAREFEPAA